VSISEIIAEIDRTLRGQLGVQERRARLEQLALSAWDTVFPGNEAYWKHPGALTRAEIGKRCGTRWRSTSRAD